MCRFYNFTFQKVTLKLNKHFPFVYDLIFDFNLEFAPVKKLNVKLYG